MNKEFIIFTETLSSPSDVIFMKNKLFLSKNKDYFIINKNKFPLKYIRTVYFGTPKVYATNSDDKLAGRDVSMRVIYQSEFQDFILIYFHNGDKYIFDSLQFSNREYRIERTL